MGLLQGAVKFRPVDALPGLFWMGLFRPWWFWSRLGFPTGFRLSLIPVPILIFFLQAGIFHVKHCPARIRIENCNILPFKDFVRQAKGRHLTLLFRPCIPAIQVFPDNRGNRGTIGTINCPVTGSEMYYLWS